MNEGVGGKGRAGGREREEANWEGFSMESIQAFARQGGELVHELSRVVRWLQMQHA